MSRLPGEVAVVLGEFRGVVDGSLNDPAFLAALSDPAGLLAGGRTIHEGRNRLASLRLEAPAGGLAVVLKQFRPRGIDRIKSLFLPGKAFRAWRGARALLDRGISTPRPLAYLERRKKGMMVEGYFLSEQATNVREVRELFVSLRGDALDRLLHSLAPFLKMCHDKGIVHRDLSDGNVLAAEDGRGGYVFQLLDTNRVRLAKRVAGLRAASNLVRLGLPRESRKEFLAAYHRGRPSGALFILWYRFRKRWYTFLVHAKKALGLKKLARKLGVQ